MTAFEERTYRVRCRTPGLVSFIVRVKETDLWCLADSDLSAQAEESISRHRLGLEAYLAQNPGFISALDPVAADPLAPALVRAMIGAGRAAGTGPMAAVAGAIAQAVGRDLLAHGHQAAVENGGDCFLAINSGLTVAIHAGDSPLSDKLGVRLVGEDMPVCLATSSGRVGHSYSRGRAHAAVVRAADGALADACATALGNRVQTKADLEAAVNWALGVAGVEGALVILGERLAAGGRLELTEL